MQFTQIYRNISRNISGLARIVLAAAIIAGTAFFVQQGENVSQKDLADEVSKDRQNVALRLQLARELETRGEIEQARREILTGLNFAPRNSYAATYYGEILKKSNNLEEETFKTKQILDRRPDYQQAWAKLAILYDSNGEIGLANAARQKSEELARN